MKTFQTFIGIDISKLSLDVSVIHQKEPNKAMHYKVSNDSKGISKLLGQVSKSGADLQNTLFVCENTGIYTTPLMTEMSSRKLHYWVVAAIEIKRSQGLSRGKSDKADAKTIALYGLTHQHRYEPSALPQTAIQQLKLLFTEREKIQKAIVLFVQTKENEGYLPKEVFAVVKKLNQQQTCHLEKALAKIEGQMLEIVKQDTVLHKQHELLTSVPGIGKQTALYLIITTRSFTSFNTWRQLACYAGVAPFEYSSGTSLRGRTKVSDIADKKMKSLLQMCVLSAVKCDKEIKAYYEKKKAEGKPAMLVMNNVRAKLLARVFAVIKRGTPFVNTQKFAA
jgi:transposase